MSSNLVADVSFSRNLLIQGTQLTTQYMNAASSSMISSGIGVNVFNGVVGLGIQPTSFEIDLSTDFARKLTTSTWTTGSDERIKTNIQSANLERCAEIVDSLDLKYFEWKFGVQTVDRHALGWIAQDVQEYFPNSVQPDSDGILMLNSDQLIKVLYGAIKQTQTEYFPRN